MYGLLGKNPGINKGTDTTVNKITLDLCDQSFVGHCFQFLLSSLL